MFVALNTVYNYSNTSRDINVAQYRLLRLIREFDDRFGWAKWSFSNCSEWLAWRSGITLSAARERVRTAQALRGLPQIAAAFSDGRLSYSKVRALTRAADRHNEDLLLAYALTATATQVEERCRQMRNVEPRSTEQVRRNWTRRTLSAWRNAERGTMTISLEVPLEAGEIVTQAIDRAIEAGAAASGPEFEEASWHTQQADAFVAVARAYLEGDSTGASSTASTADHYQVVIHVDESALRGEAGRADLPIETVKRLSCDGSLIPVIENGAGEPLNVGRKRRTVPPAIGCSRSEQLSSWQANCPPRAVVTGSRLFVSRLPQHPLRRRPPRRALERRRRDQPGQSGAAVQPPSPSGTRRRLPDSPRCRRTALFRTRRRPGDPAVRLRCRRCAAGSGGSGEHLRGGVAGGAREAAEALRGGAGAGGRVSATADA